MTRGVGDPTYVTYDPIWTDGTPLEPGYPAGYRTMVSLFASPSYHPNTMIMQVMDNEEYANSPPAVGRRSVTTGLWEQAAGPVDAVALIDYGDGAGTFIWDTFMPAIVWPPTSSYLYTAKYKSQFTDTTDDFQYVELESTYPFAFSKRSPTPMDKGRSDLWTRLHCLSYNSAATMLVGQQNGSGISPDIHTKWSMWAPGPNAIGFFKSNDAGFSGRYGNGTTDSGTIPQGFLIDKHDHLWVWTHANITKTIPLWLDEYSWSIVGTDITLTHLNRYQMNIQDSGNNTWQYTVLNATYNEDTDTIVFYWQVEFPSGTFTNRDPVAINYVGPFDAPGQLRITHFDIATRSKQFCDADSILVTKASDGLLLTTYGNTTEEPNFSGVPGFLGTDMNEDGDRFTGTWTKQDWTCFVCRNETPSRGFDATTDGFFYIDINTGVATKYDDWPEDLLPDNHEGGPDPPGSLGVYTFAGAIYEPINEKFWAGRRNQGLAGINGPEPEEVWYYVTDGFGIYGWDSPDCPPCEEDTEPCGDVVEPACDAEWPFSELQPRNVGVHMVPVTMGGGRSLADGREQAGATANGFWRITYESVRVNTAAKGRRWHELEALLDGRGGVICVHVYDGKRAPWLTVGGTIDITAEGAFTAGSRSGSIKVTTGGVLESGMLFSYGDRLYQLATVGIPSGSPPVYPVTIWPNVRVAIPDDAALVFDHPTCRCRLADDDGMRLQLHLHQHASPSVDFEEDF